MAIPEQENLDQSDPVISLGCALSTSVRIALCSTARHGHDPVHLAAALGHGAAHFPRQHVTKVGKGFPFPLQILIAALDQFHKLTRVDVRITRRVDVFDDLGWELDTGERGIGRIRGVGSGGLGSIGRELGVSVKCFERNGEVLSVWCR